MNERTNLLHSFVNGAWQPMPFNPSRVKWTVVRQWAIESRRLSSICIWPSSYATRNSGSRRSTRENCVRIDTDSGRASIILSCISILQLIKSWSTLICRINIRSVGQSGWQCTMRLWKIFSSRQKVRKFIYQAEQASRERQPPTTTTMLFQYTDVGW